MTTLCEIDIGKINSVILRHRYWQKYGIKQMKSLVFKVPGSTDVERGFLALGQLKCLNYFYYSISLPNVIPRHLPILTRTSLSWQLENI